MHSFTSQGIKFAYYMPPGTPSSFDDEKPVVMWGHGWGQTHAGFLPLISSLEKTAHHIALDFPGFGASDMPPQEWSTASYADAIAAWMKDSDIPPIIWIGHSFGGRVGVQLAARHPDCVRGLIMIAGAGLKRKRRVHKKIYFYCRIKLFKLLKKCVPDGAFKQKLMAKFGSADYKNAGPLRTIFVRVVNEDLSTQAQKITCPTSLIYGTLDDEAPAEFGQRYSQLIQDANLHLLEGQDHYSVLQNGRHPVVKIINDFIKTQSKT